MSEEGRPAAPGWYLQPDGSSWFWDGSSYTQHLTAAEVQQRAGWSTRKTWVIAIGVIAALGLAYAVAALITHKSPEDKASDACHDYVYDRLKAPTTAEFSEEHATHNDDVGFKAYGTVDSENGFGAKVRTTYICYVTDAYSVVRVSTSDD